MLKIIIEVSARHVHLSPKDAAKLFGRGYQLKELKSLSQPGEFAAKETVSIKTAKGQIDNLRVIGPTRKQTQVEITLTDARKLKIAPPVRLSGDIKGSAGATLIGPKGQVRLKEGVIVAQRHIHCDPATAKKIGLTTKSQVTVTTFGERGLVLENIPVRIAPDFVLRLHLDTDEGNASLPGGVCSQGELIINK